MALVARHGFSGIVAYAKCATKKCGKNEKKLFSLAKSSDYGCSFGNGEKSVAVVSWTDSRNKKVCAMGGHFAAGNEVRLRDSSPMLLSHGRGGG